MNRYIGERVFATAVVCAGVLSATGTVRGDDSDFQRVKAVVDAAVGPVMSKDAIPGMSVGLVIDGKPYVLNYGVASIETNAPVTNDTLFELGSISKTFTATLASLAQSDGRMALADGTSKYLPSLTGRPFGNVTLLNLATHTSGGLPLQVPDDVHSVDGLMTYLKQWRPLYAPRTYRTYSNISIGVLGLIAAKSLGASFDGVMQQRLFSALRMHHTYINVPRSESGNYAEGYRRGSPIRMTPGVLWEQAYGIRTTASDMTRFIEANMNLVSIDRKLQRAISNTHTAYFAAGPFTQDLIWEQYTLPVTLKTLLNGNSATMMFNPNRVTALTPPEKPRADMWINKTGSTNGFGAYVAFIPERRCGIALLANENYPIADRVSVAYRLLGSLCKRAAA